MPNSDEELRSNIDKTCPNNKPMENHYRVVIVDSTPSTASPTAKLEIDTTRLLEKKRKHRRMLIICI